MSSSAPAGPPWRAVAALSVTQIVAWGSQYYAIAVLAPAIAASEGWSREAIFGAYSVGLLAQGFASFPAGALIDRFGGRLVMSVGSLLSALALFALSVSPNPFVFGLAWIVTGIAMAATQYEPAFATITASFGADARRAITYLTFAGGLASTVAWPVTAALLPHTGWRGAYAFWAAVTLFVCLPLHVFLLPKVSGGVAQKQRRPLGPVLRAPAFWMVALALTAGALLFSVVGVHAIPMLQEAGLSNTEAVAIASFTGVFQVAGRVLELAGLSRLRPTRVAILASAFQPVAVVALMAAGTVPGAAWGYVVLYGVSAGILTIIRGTVPAELFGREGYGAVAGAMVAPGIMARAAGPYAAAWMWETFGGYASVKVAILVAGLLAFAAFLAAAALALNPGPKRQD
ncbi:MFS transporter [Elioraea rosea]|uniref:MFS transporter n=1 Tax=Elioraea rosea TaxID=2492390 RepID=UPI0011826158|nr:MFS transporter [Elioraea rosea]